MQAFFLDGQPGQRFCLYFAARNGKARGAVIYVHPFAEEMNKSRRMAAQQARAMAEAGFDVVQVDLFGCGDSSGDFADADWEAWLQDIQLAYRWLRARSLAPLTLWGLRAGCLLAANAAVTLQERANFIFWQPTVSGKQHLQQFLRLKMAGELLAGQGKGVTEQLRQQLVAGHSVEIAGYSLSPALAKGLGGAELQPSAGCTDTGQVAWFELSTREEASLSPVSHKFIELWRTAGWEVNAHMACGPSFWQTTEIEDAPSLIAATIASLESWT